MYFRCTPTKKELLAYNEMQSLVAPLKLRRYVNVLYEPYRSRILTAVAAGKTKVNPRTIIKTMAEIYKDCIKSYPYNLQLHTAFYVVQKTLENASPQELLPVWEYYSNGNGENK